MPDEGTDADAIDPATKWWNRPIKPETGIGTHTLDVEILVAGDGYRFPSRATSSPSSTSATCPAARSSTRPTAAARRRRRREIVGAQFRGRCTGASAGTPFKFKLGQNQVIEGLDTAISQLSAGERAKIRVGSERAFGKRLRLVPLTPPSSTSAAGSGTVL
ncbi:peptidyl-prolyl cis-trans isomerase [Aureococcus anophagefferens]|nr:peptidyl-prolyl cis-trans isomerase [Aureococcus anophagefferens]